MIWLIAYIVVGILICIIAQRIAKRHEVSIPEPDIFAFSGPPGAVILFFWPILVPLIVWSEISAKRFKEKMDRIEAEKRRNPYANLSLDEMLERLRKLYDERNDKG